jgi:tyrosyl-DNA phosphodiesterase 2
MSLVKPTPAMQAGAASFSSNIQKRYKPRKQSYLQISSDGAWVPAMTEEALPKDETEPPLHPRNLRLISWNIDMLVPFAEERMSAALNHLHDLVSSTPPQCAIVIFLQEMEASDMEQIRNSVWVKQRFNLTDVDSENWLRSHYGTITLVDRRLQIDSVFRVPWYSKFGRDGLFLDIALYDCLRVNAPPTILRLCNTHLESLRADPPVRPIQMAAATQYLSQPNVESGILAGDLNAIEPFDRSLHTDNGLDDAYLRLGGEEDSDNGYTWGYQSPRATRNRFGCTRMDKILLYNWLVPTKFQRIGMGVRVAEEHRTMMKKARQLDWVSDHYGVMCDLHISHRGQLTRAGSREGV